MDANPLPWHYKDDKIGVAITGKAFDLLNERADKDPYTLASVIHKVQVFARCAPEDKAGIVDRLQDMLDE